MNAEAFARRLQEAATARGLTSGRSRSGVDIVALSSATGMSYEMARRYAEGLASPKPDVLRLIAEWLKVSTTWLAYGEGEMNATSAIDMRLLELCIVAVTEAVMQAGVKLDPTRQAHLVGALYREAINGRRPSAASVAATLKALSG